MSFWEKNVNSQQVTISPEMVRDSNNITLDMEAVRTLQEDPNVDLFEEEEDDTTSVMADANLRLEMGRLYQMVLQNDIFADTNADPRAIKNVQREIRKLVRERMETMLGIRQEIAVQNTVVSSPFNDMEVTVLKMLASKMSKGATEETPVAQAPSPKKDGITSISGNLRPQNAPKLTGTVVASSGTKVPQKSQPVKQVAPKSAISASESALKKPIEEMTQEELAAHDAAAAARRSKNYAALPSNLVPHPSPQQLEMMYTMQANDRLAQHAQKMEIK